MEGCDWKSDKCSGTFAPSCEEEYTCLFIDPKAEDIENPDGSLAKPYDSLSQAIDLLDPELKTIIYGLNLPNTTINSTRLLDLDGKTSIHIKPFFKGQMEIEIWESFEFGQNSSLTIEDCSFKGKLTANLFQENQLNDENTTCSLRMKNSQFEIMQEKEDLSFLTFMHCDLDIETVNISGDLPFFNIGSAIRTINDVEYFNQVNINGLVIEHITQQVSNSIFTLYYANTTLNNTIFRNISAPFQRVLEIPHILKVNQGSLYVANITFHDIQQNVIKFYGDEIMFTNMSFTNIYAQNIMEIRSILKDMKTFENLHFENITVSQNVIYLGMVVKFEFLTMKHIVFYPNHESDFFFTLKNGLCIYAYRYRLRVFHSVFYNISSNCIYSTDVPIEIRDSIFSNPHNIGRLSQDELLENKFRYLNWIIVDYTALLYQSLGVSFGNVYLERNIFTSHQNPAKNGSAVYFTSYTKNIHLLVENCIFLDMSSDQGGAIFIREEMSALQDAFFSVKKSVFKNSFSYTSGGAISYQRRSTNNGVIEKCIFYNNTALGIGGAMSMSKQVSFTIEDTVFINNKAQYGGAISQLQSKTDIDSGNIILLSQATIKGGAILQSESKTSKISDKIEGLNTNFDRDGKNPIETIHYDKWILRLYNFNSNRNLFNHTLNYTDIFQNGSKIVSYNSSYDESNITKLDMKVIPGHALPNIIEVTFYNTDGSIATYIDGYNFSNVFVSGKEATLQPETVICNKGKLYIYDEIMAVSAKEKEQEFKIRSESDTRNLLSQQLMQRLYINFTVALQPCMPGDIIDPNSGLCDPCPNKLFSLSPPTDENVACQNCPENMICLGGSTILPAQGFYRFNKNSSIALECTNPQACAGGVKGTEINVNGFCSPPFRGNLCSQCEDGYAPSKNNQSCIQCNNDYMFYLTMAGQTIFSICVIVYGVRRKIVKGKSFSEASEAGDQERIAEVTREFDLSCALKMIFTFMQMFAIIKVINFNWNPQLSFVYSFGSKLIPSMVHSFSSRCLFLFLDADPETSFYYQFLLTIVSPLLFMLLIIPILYVFNRRAAENRESFVSMMKVSILIIFYVEQPQILLEALGLFSCRKLGDDDSQYYLQENLDIKCYTTNYYKWALGLGVPVIIVWGLAYPFYLLVVIVKSMRNGKKDPQLRQQMFSKYSFIVAGYKDSKYFWEFMILLRKLLMVLIVIGIDSTDKQAQGAFIILILTLFLYLHTRFEPYQNEAVGSLDATSITAILIIVFLGIYFKDQKFSEKEQATETNYVLVNLLTFLGIFVVIMCIYKFLGLLFSAYSRKIKRRVNTFKNSIKPPNKEINLTQTSNSSSIDATHQSNDIL